MPFLIIKIKQKKLYIYKNVRRQNHSEDQDDQQQPDLRSLYFPGEHRARVQEGHFREKRSHREGAEFSLQGQNSRR